MLRSRQNFGRAVSPRSPRSTGDERAGFGETALPKTGLRVQIIIKIRVRIQKTNTLSRAV
jgi:hypothetical protein